MSALNAAALLTAWETGTGQGPVQRALALLATAWPDQDEQQWAQVSIGERDERLLTLREELFGTVLESVANCPRCQERLEVQFDTGTIRSESRGCNQPMRLSAAGYDIECRVPNSADLLSIAATPGTDPERQLLARCVLHVRQDEHDLAPAALPAAAIEAVTMAMAEADPQADVRIGLVCPACEHRWAIPFDIFSYVWDEIDDWAQRVLYEIHALAQAYGWRESEILSLTARRRRWYLDMINV